jgi:hypothetical protein
MCGVSMLSLVGAARAGAAGGDPGAGLGSGIVLLLVTIVVYGLGGLTSLGLTVTGHVFTLAAPPKHGARTLAMVALILLGATLACSLLGGLLGGVGGGTSTTVVNGRVITTGGGPGIGAYIGMISYATLPAYWLVFLFCIRSLGLGMSDQGVSKGAIALMIVLGVDVLLTCLLPCIGFAVVMMSARSAAMNAQNAPNPDAAMGGMMGSLFAGGIVMMIMLGILVLVYLATYIWYVVLLFQTRGAIDRHLGAGD